MADMPVLNQLAIDHMGTVCESIWNTRGVIVAYAHMYTNGNYSIIMNITKDVNGFRAVGVMQSFTAAQIISYELKHKNYGHVRMMAIEWLKEARTDVMRQLANDIEIGRGALQQAVREAQFDFTTPSVIGQSERLDKLIASYECFSQFMSGSLKFRYFSLVKGRTAP